MLQFNIAKSNSIIMRCLWWSDLPENLALTISNQSAFSELRFQTAQTCKHLTFLGLRLNGPRQLQIASPRTKRLNVRSSWQRINQLTPLPIVTVDFSFFLNRFLSKYLRANNSCTTNGSTNHSRSRTTISASNMQRSWTRYDKILVPFLISLGWSHLCAGYHLCTISHLCTDLYIQCEVQLSYLPYFRISGKM